VVERIVEGSSESSEITKVRLDCLRSTANGAEYCQLVEIAHLLLTMNRYLYLSVPRSCYHKLDYERAIRLPQEAPDLFDIAAPTVSKLVYSVLRYLWLDTTGCTLRML